MTSAPAGPAPGLAPGLAPFVITVAPNGGRRSKRDHPRLPLTGAEIAEDAAATADAGAGMLHLHVRGANGEHLLDAGVYRNVIARVRAAVGDRLIIQVTSESGGRYSIEQQYALVRELRPECVSLSLRELAPTEQHERTFGALLDWLATERVLVQHILFTIPELERFATLRRRGVIPGDRPAVLFVLGHYSDPEPGEPGQLPPFLVARDAAELAGSWTVCAFGRHEGACALAAATLGGHARVGFENNLHLANGSLAPDNAALVRQLAESCAVAGRRVVRADEARAALFGE